MTNYEELKLAVYESGLDQEDIEEIVDLMESCDDDELQEVCESVEDLLVEVYEASKEEADRLERQGKLKRELNAEYDANRTRMVNVPSEIRKDNAVKTGKYGSQYERMTPEQKRRQDIRKATSSPFYDSFWENKKKPVDKSRKHLDGRRNNGVFFSNSYTQDRADKLEKLYKGKIARSRSQSNYNKVVDDYNRAQESIGRKLHNLGTKSSIMNDMQRKIKKKLGDNQSLTPREQEFKDKYPKLFESACLDLYEACDNGDITIKERDYYLEHVSELFEEE